MKVAVAARPSLRLRMPEPLEQQCLNAIRAALRYHPAVAEVWRINSGRAWLPAKDGKERPIRFHDIDGCSDLIGLLKDGRMLAVECKRPSTRNAATEAQLAFLRLVRKHGGIAFVAAAADEAITLLNAQLGHREEVWEQQP